MIIFTATVQRQFNNKWLHSYDSPDVQRIYRINLPKDLESVYMMYRCVTETRLLLSADFITGMRSNVKVTSSRKAWIREMSASDSMVQKGHVALVTMDQLSCVEIFLARYAQLSGSHSS